jgi:hypothetical protein
MLKPKEYRRVARGMFVGNSYPIQLLPVCPSLRSFCDSIDTSPLINTSRLNNHVRPYKGQTASRRSVEKKDVRNLHYADAALFF